MSSISSNFSSAANYSSVAATTKHQRPDTTKMADELFSKLDSTGKGYIEESDLASALSGLQSTSSSSKGSSGASEIFSQLDADGDGKVTQSEMETGIKKLADALDSQFHQTRMQGGIPPPPPPANDKGFTKDELTSQLSEIGSSDTQRAGLLNKIVQNFDAADTDGDGKVSFAEATAYEKTTSSTASSSTNSASSSTTDTQTSDAQMFRQILDLLRAYGDANGKTASSSVSAIA